jgi:CubicO group peptidase (beta-lactamase class C family)
MLRKSLSLILPAVVALNLSAQVNQTYEAPVFNDPDRYKKVQNAFLTVSKLYFKHAETNHFPGIAFGIVLDGKLVYSGVQGYTDVAKKTLVSANSMFRIASMSKSVTALSILRLRDEGKLQLDDPVYKYVPEMKQNTLLTQDATPITIRHLLTHAAGFPEDNPWGDRQLADTDKELIDLIEKGTFFSNAPGVTYEYSNLGFALLGYIVKQVSGMSYAQYTKEKIFAPLGMRETEWEYSNVPTNKLALGYRWENGKWVEEPLLHDGSYGPMGGLITSIEDFSKYMALHFSAWPPRNDEESPVLKRSSLREMHMPANISGFNTNFRYASGRNCPIFTAYAYGLNWLRDCESRVYVGHSGGLPGFGSQWRFLPEYGIGVVAFGNLTYAGFGGINLAVLDTLIKIAGLKPRQIPASPILNQRKEELLKIFPEWNNAGSSRIFAENFFPDYNLDSLKKTYKALYAKAGKIISVGDIIAENQLRGRFIIKGEKIDIEVFFTLSPENPPLIQQLDVAEIPKKN